MDYMAINESVTFPMGAGVVLCVNVDINDDTALEPTEDFTVGISAPPGTDPRVQLGPPARITVVIIGLWGKRNE